MKTHLTSFSLGYKKSFCVLKRPCDTLKIYYQLYSYLDIIEKAISDGDTLLIENIGETVEPVLDPLLGRNTIKKGR